MPLSRIKLLPVDPAGFETAEPSWDWWDVDPGIKIVMAHLQAQGPTPAPSDVKRLKADAAGALQVTTAGQTAPGTSRIDLPSGVGGLLNNAGSQGDLGAAQQTASVAAMIFNGTSFDRVRSASALDLAAQSGQGVALAAPPGEWTAAAQPVAGTQASASRAAGGAGVRHVARALVFSAGSIVAPALSSFAVNLRDGASGAGGVLLSFEVVITAVVGQNCPPIMITGLNVVGSANTAMTFEWSGGLANLIESVGLTGYDTV